MWTCTQIMYFWCREFLWHVSQFRTDLAACCTPYPCVSVLQEKVIPCCDHLVLTNQIRPQYVYPLSVEQNKIQRTLHVAFKQAHTVAGVHTSLCKITEISTAPSSVIANQYISSDSLQTVAQLLDQIPVFNRIFRFLTIFPTACLTPSHLTCLAYLSSVLKYICHWTISL
jgi:hypothetical protein